MVHLRQIRIDANLKLKEMSERLGISLATLSRIEAAERDGRKYVMEERNASHIVARLNDLFQQSYAVKDLEAIEIAPPRAGRPKKVKSEEAKGETDV